MSFPDPPDERLREEFTSLAEVAGEGRQCPTTERLLESVRGELDRADNEAVILHLGECTSCATAWRTARGLAEQTPGRQAERVTSFFRHRWYPLAAAAAVLVTVVGVGLYLIPQRPEPSPVFRTQESNWIRPAFPDDRPLPRDACVLLWTEGPEGTTYDVRVTSEDLDPLARGWRLDRAEYGLDPAVLKGLPAGEALLWRVTAHLPDGRQVTSRTFRTPIE